MLLRCLFLGCALSLALATCPAIADQPARNPDAQRHYDAGLAYVDDPNGPKWEEALREFRAAFRASGQWKLQNNIGLCALNLERDAEALEAYREYLARSGEELSKDKRKQIEKDVAMLSASLVSVDIEVTPGEATVVDERKNSKGESIVNRYSVRQGRSSLGLHPGYHKITLEASGHLPEEWVFEAEPASTHRRGFHLTPRPLTEGRPSAPMPPRTPAALSGPNALQPSDQRTPVSVYVGLVTTGVLAAAATTTGLLALGRTRDYERENDPARRDNLEKSGRALALVTDIEAGAALLSAGLTAYFYFAAPRRAAPSVASRSRFIFTPAATTDALVLTLAGPL